MLTAPAHSIAVVIATRDRPHLLSARALASVTSQTRAPDRLIVVDDSCADARAENQAIVQALHLQDCRVVYVANARSDGASGSWNTALDILTEVNADGDPFVAILDDDDAWRPHYLAKCEAEAERRGLDMVASDLQRIESPSQPPKIQEAPSTLSADACLVGNPGIQGSNIFARLSVLLEAGGFDEALRSTTDRDLCIRIADLRWVRYGRLPEALVEHYADADRDRLSTRGSAAKVDGLSAFWRKHGGRMRSDQRSAFTARAAALFDWSPPTEPSFPEDSPTCGLVLGLVASHDRPTELFEIIRRIAESRDRALIGADVVLFEEGERASPGTTLLEVAAALLRDAGVRCFCRSRAQPGETPATLVRCAEAVARARAKTEIWLADQRAGVEAPDDAGMSAILRWLGARRSPRASATASDTGELERWVAQERATTAADRLRRRFHLGEVRCLGSGSEAVVFTDGRFVYKYIDAWLGRMPTERVAFLRSQVGRWAGMPGLYALREVAEDGPSLIITYDFEESTPYTGGREDEVIALLNGCYAAGIVCNNVHPKNLIVTASGVRLIDYGSDIRPWSPRGFEHMARRAYLACHYATHPDLVGLMRRALNAVSGPEFTGYGPFRARVASTAIRQAPVDDEAGPRSACAEALPSSLYVGVITSEPTTALPLLRGLGRLAKEHGLARLTAVVLDNASPACELEHALREAREGGLRIAVVSVSQQRLDAAAGAFGRQLRERPAAAVGIAAARTMLQRYVGALMERDPGSFAWILDDDMRVDARAIGYLRWLPKFRDAGVSVLIGAYEGSSPNPPLNGLRVQLVDILHNFVWLRGLPEGTALPDRSAENAATRARFPDYYYDLSRRHTAHLETPYWLERSTAGETVAEARHRLLTGALGVLSGQPLARALVSCILEDPVEAAKDSVNRGGNTFVLDHRALTQTPNMTPRVRGREARRSDMIWAVVNRYYRRMSVKAVAFPVHHIGRVTGPPRLDLDKVQGEIVGSALYAGLVEFLSTRPDHTLELASTEVAEIKRLSDQHRGRRLRGLRQSIQRIIGLRAAIRGVASGREFEELLSYLDAWFTPTLFDQIRDGVCANRGDHVETFLTSLRTVADDYAAATVDTLFLESQLGAATGR